MNDPRSEVWERGRGERREGGVLYIHTYTHHKHTAHPSPLTLYPPLPLTSPHPPLTLPSPSPNPHLTSPHPRSPNPTLTLP